MFVILSATAWLWSYEMMSEIEGISEIDMANAVYSSQEPASATGSAK